MLCVLQGGSALCPFTEMAFQDGQAIPEVFPLVPKAVPGSCDGKQLWSVGKEGRKELSWQTVSAELCPAVQGLGEGTKQWNLSARNAVTAGDYFFQKCGELFLKMHNFS